MDERSYEEDTRIDENCDLSGEWQKQAERMMYWSRKHSIAITKTNRAREKLRVVKGEVKRDTDKERAKVYFDIRKYPGDYGLSGNPTEAAINNAINMDNEFVKFCEEQEGRVNTASNELVDAIEEENLYDGAVKAMSHKKRALENLQSLWEKNWFGEPNNRLAKLDEAQRTGQTLRDQMRTRRN